MMIYHSNVMIIARGYKVSQSVALLHCVPAGLVMICSELIFFLIGSERTGAAVPLNRLGYPSSMAYGTPMAPMEPVASSCLVASRPNLQAIQTRGWHQALGQAAILEVRFHG